MVQIENLKASETQKHYELDARQTPEAWEDYEEWSCHIRVVSPVELSEKEMRKLIESAMESKNLWKQTKKGYHSFKKPGNPASVYITKMNLPS